MKTFKQFLNEGINQDSYNYWIVVDNKIESGWEFIEDAQNHLVDIPEGKKGEIKTIFDLKEIGLDPNKDTDWLTGKWWLENVNEIEPQLERANLILETLKKKINVPYINAYVSTLGGAENASVLFSFSLEPKKNWKYGIFENSPFFHFHITPSEPIIIELITKAFDIETKFRKSRAKTVNDLVKKLNTYIDKVKKERK